MRGLNRVAGKSGDDDLVFVHGVLANDAFVFRFGSMQNTILVRLGIVPVFDSKRCRPARFNHGRSGNFNPLAVFLDFQANGFGVAGFEVDKAGRSA